MLLAAIIIIGIISFFVVFSRIMNVDSDKYWIKLAGVACFILLVFFLIGLGMFMGKLMFRGTPIPFSDLTVERRYEMVQVIDANHAFITMHDNYIENKDILLLIEKFPKEIATMKKGETFEVKDIPSIMSRGHFIAPILHPQ